MTKNDILQFDVTMNNLSLVHIVNSLNDLPHQDRCRFLAKMMTFLKQIVKMTITSQFQEKIDILLITEEIVKFNEIRVIQKCLDFYLPYQLL